MVNKQNESPNIFKGKENELKTRFEKDGYDWEEVKSRLESVERDEQIDRKLTELEGKTDDYYNYLKGLIDKQVSENSSEKPKEKEEDKKSFISDTKEKAKQKVIEEAEKKGGFYGAIARFFLEGTEEKADDSFLKKAWNGIKVGLGMAILGWFGIKGLEVSGVIDNAKEKASSAASAITESIDSAKENVESAKEKVNSGAEKVGEVLKNRYSSTGLLILKTFSIDKFEAQDTTDLFSKFQNQKFLSLKNRFSLMDNSGEMKETEVRKFRSETPGLENYSTEDIYNMLKIFFATKTTNILFKERLSSQNIENIIKTTDRKKLDKILGEGKVDEIVSKNYDFTELDLKTITSLMGLSYKGFIGSSILEGFEAGKNFFNDLFLGQDGVNIFNELKSDLEERKNNLLPASVYGVLKGDSGVNFGGSQKVDIKLEDLDTTKLAEDDLNKLKKFLSFRDTVLNEFRKSDSKFALGLPDFKENFNKAINLKEIIYLYLVFDGETSFLNGNDSMAKAGIYAWLYKLFEGNKQTSNFAGKYVAKIENGLRDGSPLFTDDEKIFINVLIYKITGTFLKPYVEAVKQIEGFVTQELAELLMRLGVSRENANDLAHLIEVAGGVIAFFTLKRLKLLRFAIIPLIPAIGLFIAGSYNESILRNKIKKEQYDFISEIFNQFLSEEKPKITVDGKEIIVSSLDDLQTANENPAEAVDKQRKFDYYVIEKGKAKGITKEESSKKSREIVLEINSTGYNIHYRNNKYRIKNSMEIIYGINGMLPDSYAQRKFTNPHLAEDFSGINFGSGADVFKISFNKIVNAFRRGADENGNYTLEEDAYLGFDVILEKQ